MKERMLSAAHQLQVSGAVVQFVSVDVVDMLGGIKRSPYFLFHHIPMFKDSAAIDTNKTVATLVNAAIPFRSQPARATPIHRFAGNGATAINTSLFRRLYGRVMTGTATRASGTNLDSTTIRTQLGRLGAWHCWTSLTGLVVRRAGGVDALPGFSLPQLYQKHGN